MKKLILSAIVAATALTASAASATQAWVGQNHLNARSGPGTNHQVLWKMEKLLLIIFQIWIKKE